MAIECCDRCGRFVDLDWDVDDIEYFDNMPICADCWTDDEWEVIEGK